MTRIGPRLGRVRTLHPGELAWISAPPCALLLLAALMVLGPPLGHAFLTPHAGETLWPYESPYIFGAPEPTKHARYLIALLGPALLAGVVLVGARRRMKLSAGVTRVLVTTSQALVLAFLIAAVLGQDRFSLPVGTRPWQIFSVPTYVVAAVAPLLLLPVMRRPRVVRRIARLVPDTRPRRIAGLAVAGLYAATWLVTAVDSDATIAHAQTSNLIAWGMDDPFAVLDGRTPLVDFHAMYAQLWPYPTAAAMQAFGATITVYTLVMTGGGALALLAVYAVFRRIARSSLLALALYLPFVAASFMLVFDWNGIGLSNVKIFSMWPMRYAGPYVLAWLTARHLDRAAPRRAWPLFLVAGLVVIDNLEFGLAALAATLVALACAQPPRSWRAAGRLAGEGLVGLLGAALLVALATLARTGELPRFALMLEFPRIFGVLGLASSPMPALGFHLALYVTFVAAIGTAVVRRMSGGEEPLLTGMLAWSGVFGLIAASYFIGRSDRLKLGSLLSVWSMALALLVVVVVRALAARDWRRPSLAELMVLVGFGLAICLLVETPTPWSQLARLRQTTPPVFKQPEATLFVAAHSRRGEPVAILIELGHRIAYDLGIDNVAPYSFIEAMVTRRQTQNLIDAMRHAHAHKLFLRDGYVVAEQRAALTAAGLTPRADTGGLSEWSDAGAAELQIAPR